MFAYKWTWRLVMLLVVVWFLPVLVVGVIIWGVEGFVERRRRRKRGPAKVIPFGQRPVTREDVVAKMDELALKAAQQIVEAFVDEGRIEK